MDDTTWTIIISLYLGIMGLIFYVGWMRWCSPGEQDDSQNIRSAARMTLLSPIWPVLIPVAVRTAYEAVSGAVRRTWSRRADFTLVQMWEDADWRRRDR